MRAALRHGGRDASAADAHRNLLQNALSRAREKSAGRGLKMDIESFASKVKAALAENQKKMDDFEERLKKAEETLARLTKKDDDDDW